MTALRLFTVVVIAQAITFGGTQFICRYTGQVMESCCCPSENAVDSSSAKLADSCCDVRITERAVFTSVVHEQGNSARAWVSPSPPSVQPRHRATG